MSAKLRRRIRFSVYRIGVHATTLLDVFRFMKGIPLDNE
jgi:hypothetical protein